MKTRCCQAASQAVSLGSGSWTVISPIGGSFLYDTDGFHDGTNPGRIKIPAGYGGNFLVFAEALITGSSTKKTSQFGVRILKNGATSYSQVFNPGDNGGVPNGQWGPSTVALLSLAAGDYVEAQAFQASGFSLNCQVQLTIIYVGSTNCCYAYGTGNSLASGAYGVVNLDQEDVDTSSMHSTVTNPSRVTVPSTGDYLLMSHYTVGGTTAQLVGKIRKNGTTDISALAFGQDANPVGVTNVEVGGAEWAIASLTAGDYIELLTFQDSGSAQTSKGSLTVVALSGKYAQAQRVTTSFGGTSGFWLDAQFNGETHDTDSMHDNTTNPQRLTINTAGDYLFTSMLALLGEADVTTNRTGGLRYSKNGVAASSVQNVGLTDPAQTFKTVGYTIYPMVVADYMTTQFFFDPPNSVQVTGSVFTGIRINDWFEEPGVPLHPRPSAVTFQDPACA